MIVKNTPQTGIMIVKTGGTMILKNHTRCLLVPVSLAPMRHELHLYVLWYNTQRTHMGLVGKTPQEISSGRSRGRRRFEPRSKWPHRPRHRCRGTRFTLDASYIEGRKHLPVIELRHVA
jgi:hypothetical protein